MKFNEEIKSWRLDCKLRIKEAADKLKVSVRTYESWERDLRTPHALSLPEIRRRMNEVKNATE